MHRIDADGHVGNLFDDGDPAIPQVATQVDAAWLNGVQETVCKAIEAAGITLVKGTDTQLSQALALMVQGVEPGGRLTLTTAVPVTTSDVSAAGTVYYTPHRNNRIVLYDGSKWVWYTFTELSQATTDATKSPAACGNNSNYDVFVWNDAGTLRATRGPAWSSGVARGAGAGTTELEFFEGRYVNKEAITNGPAARRGLYVGSVRTDGAAVVNDTLALRHVWNTYNRVERALLVIEATNNWAYSTNVLRQANANAANQISLLAGMVEDAVEVEVRAHMANDTGGAAASVGIGLDSTSTNVAGALVTQITLGAALTGYAAGAKYVGFPGLGYHYLAWLEAATATGNTTWYGDNASSVLQSGMAGRWRA